MYINAPFYCLFIHPNDKFLWFFFHSRNYSPILWAISWISLYDIYSFDPSDSMRWSSLAVMLLFFFNFLLFVLHLFWEVHCKLFHFKGKKRKKEKKKNPLLAYLECKSKILFFRNSSLARKRFYLFVLFHVLLRLFMGYHFLVLNRK